MSLSYPMDGMIAKIIAWLGALFIKFKTKSFRPYIHPVNEIRDVFNAHQYRKIEHTIVFPWHVETYIRKD